MKDWIQLFLEDAVNPDPTLQLDPHSGLAFRTAGAAPGAASALLVLLHGVGGNETDLAGLGRLQAAGVQVVLARGPLALGPDRFAWFEVRFTAQGPAIRADQAEASRLQLARLVESLQDRQQVGPGRTVIAGFSQGGIMSAGLALTEPRRVAGFGLLSGRILPEIAPRIGAPADLARLSGFVAHGRADQTLPLAWAERSDAWLTELGVPHRTAIYPGGHELTETMARDCTDWLAGLWGRSV